MVFLHAHGVGTARAVRIFKTSASTTRLKLSIASCPPGLGADAKGRVAQPEAG